MILGDQISRLSLSILTILPTPLCYIVPNFSFPNKLIQFTHTNSPLKMETKYQSITNIKSSYHIMPFEIHTVTNKEIKDLQSITFQLIQRHNHHNYFSIFNLHNP